MAETTTTTEATVDTSNTTAVDTQAIQESVAEIYVATFGRAPDKDGLDYWTNEVVSGNLTLDGVSKSFFDQPETKNMYGDSSNEDFIISVYANTLGKDVDGSDEGVQYWASELESGNLSKDTFIKAIVDGAKAETGSPEDAALLHNKVTTGLLYAQEIGEADSPLAKQVMEKVTSDATTAEDAMATVNFYKDWVDSYDTALGDDAGVTKKDLYAHIDDDEYWNNLDQTHELNFDTQPTVKFWEQDNSLWSNDATSSTDTTASGEASVSGEATASADDFAFLKNKDAWHDASGFEKFDSHEYADMTPDSIYKMGDLEDTNISQDTIDSVSSVLDGKEVGQNDDVIKEATEILENDSAVADMIDNNHSDSDSANVGNGFTGFAGFNETHNSETDYGYDADSESYDSNTIEITGTQTTDTTADIA